VSLLLETYRIQHCPFSGNNRECNPKVYCASGPLESLAQAIMDKPSANLRFLLPVPSTVAK